MQSLIPSKVQLKFLDWEFGLFFHFGIRTFYSGHRDWDMEEMSADRFYPANLDCEEWLCAARIEPRTENEPFWNLKIG